MEIKFDILGKILEGKYTGWTIVLEKEDEDSYYAIIWSQNEDCGYDDWFESFDRLKQFIEENYVIEWTDEIYAPRTPTDEEIETAERILQKAKERFSKKSDK